MIPIGFIRSLRLVFVAAMAALTLAVLFYYYLFWSSPRFINEVSGSVIPLSEHGIVFYVQDWQNVLLISLIVLGAIGFLGIVGLDVRRRSERGVLGAHLDVTMDNPDQPNTFDLPPAILTRRMTMAMVVLIFACFLVVGSGGAFPFGLFS